MLGNIRKNYKNYQIIISLKVDELRNKLDSKNKLIEKKTNEALQVIFLFKILKTTIDQALDRAKSKYK